MTVEVLDKGYVRLVDHMGDDLRIVNAARVSYDKASENWSDRDASLLSFLMREGHTSVLRHATLTFECYAPLMVARQWYKHAVGSTYLEDQNGWNESSRRYVTEDEQFYIPDVDSWRSKPANSKQGSGANFPGYSDYIYEAWERGEYDLDLDMDSGHKQTGSYWQRSLYAHVTEGERLYKEAMDAGVAPEQARLFLAANGLYIRFYWTVSLAAFLHFLQLRDESHAQFEIQEYARAMKGLVEPKFPETFKAVFE